MSLCRLIKRAHFSNDALKLSTFHRKYFSSLSSEQLSLFNDDGFLSPAPFCITPSEVSSLRSALDDLIKRFPDTPPENLVNAHLLGPDRVDTNSHEVADAIASSNAFLEIGRHPSIVRMVSDAFGGDGVFLWGCQVFCKKPHTGKLILWHQDGLFWPMLPLRAITVWVAIDRSDADNGALRVVPGTHRSELPHQNIEANTLGDRPAFQYGIPDSELPTGEAAVTFELEEGEMSLHDSMLVHGSDPNKSSRRRAGLTLNYMPTSSHFRRDVLTAAAQNVGYNLGYSTRPLLLVHGEVQNKNNTLVYDCRKNEQYGTAM